MDPKDRAVSPPTGETIWETPTGSTLFTALFDAAPDALVVVDASGEILLANERITEVLGFEAEELVGQPVETLVPHALREDHVAHRDTFFAVPTARPMGIGLQLKAVHREGREIPVEISLSPIESPDGTLVMAAIRDVTERRRNQRELQRYAHRLELSNREWEQFAHVISHDLQEPLRTIRIHLQRLERTSEGILTEEMQEHMGFVQDGARRLHNLVRDLLAYSRVDTRAAPRETVAVGDVLEAVLGDLEVRVHETGAEVTWDPLPSVKADPVQLGQVLQNLLTNAMKFVAPGRRPRIHVSAVRQLEGWRIDVADDGIGIPPEQAERVFVLFQRLQGRGEGEGEGIGLAVCRKIVERHGGRIWFTPRSEGGTTFHVVLPAAGTA